MVRNSIVKIVSLHMDPCSFICPNSDVCYHKRKEVFLDKTARILPFNFRVELLKKGYIIYESICNNKTITHTTLIDIYPTYNVTLPYSVLGINPHFWGKTKQIQVTVHTKEQAKSIPSFQKLFLIKDDKTYAYAVKERLFELSDMHFCINQTWITKDKLRELMCHCRISNTIDSCATSWLLNGCCPYSHGTYIDITYDGTIRSCPFNKKGVLISDIYNGDYESLFTLNCAPEICKYSEMFGEPHGTNEHTSI